MISCQNKHTHSTHTKHTRKNTRTRHAFAPACGSLLRLFFCCFPRLSRKGLRTSANKVVQYYDSDFMTSAGVVTTATIASGTVA